jgi:hypothetical protein
VINGSYTNLQTFDKAHFTGITIKVVIFLLSVTFFASTQYVRHTTHILKEPVTFVQDIIITLILRKYLGPLKNCLYNKVK